MKEYKKYFFTVFIITILLDMLAKSFVYTYRVYYKITDFLSINLVINKGSAFGLIENFNTGFLIISIAVLLILTAVLRYSVHSKFDSIMFALIFSGGVGNIIDRIAYGGVIDFIDFKIGYFHWPTFNFADAFITIGVVSLVIKSLLKRI